MKTIRVVAAVIKSVNDAGEKIFSCRRSEEQEEISNDKR